MQQLLKEFFMVNCNKNFNRCEILAPAGSYEAMIAAFNAGADAVYAGGQNFGARAYAGNFSNEELIEAIEYAHLFNKKIYLTVNTLLKENELNILYEYLEPYYNAGLDAVIVQDFGVLEYIASHFKDLPIHCSTQMTITGPDFAQFLSENKSISRIVTPRELNISEIKDIYEKTGLEIESFVHGALCYCYSGQCLLSSVIGGRSGNRGRCAQPCRLTYSSDELQVKNKHLLSPKDLCTLYILPDILEAGVYSLKIEGRMKKPEYVSGVTAIYRKYADLYFKYGREKYSVDEEDIILLKEIYNRGGFTDGFYMCQNSSEIMTIDRPNHCGVVVGSVLGQKNNIISIKAIRDIHKGDVLEICDDVEFFAPYDIKKNTCFDYKLKENKAFRANKEVRRTRNEILVKGILSKYLYNEKGALHTLKRYVNIEVSICTDTPISATMWDEDFSVTVSGVIPLTAKNKPIGAEAVKKQLCKLGGTYLSVEGFNINIEDGLFLPVAALNELRRKLVDAFLMEICNKYMRNSSKSADFNKDTEVYKDAGVYKDADSNKKTVFNNIDLTNNKDKAVIRSSLKLCKNARSDNYCRPNSKFTILVSNMEQLNTVISIYNTNRIYIEYANFSIDEIETIIHKLADKDIDTFIALPYIFRHRAVEEFDKNLSAIKKLKPTGYLFRNLESYFYMKNADIDIGTIVFDSNIYSFNNEDIKFYKKIGADIVTASYELNSNELSVLDKEDMELNIYGLFPVMLSAGCIRKTMNRCINNHLKSSDHIDLTDRKNIRFKVNMVCRYCYNIIYNSVPLSLFGNLNELERHNFSSYRINFTIETAEEVKEILRNYNNLKGDFTKCHFKRGVE